MTDDSLHIAFKRGQARWMCICICKRFSISISAGYWWWASPHVTHNIISRKLRFILTACSIKTPNHFHATALWSANQEATWHDRTSAEFAESPSFHKCLAKYAPWIHSTRPPCSTRRARVDAARENISNQTIWFPIRKRRRSRKSPAHPAVTGRTHGGQRWGYQMTEPSPQQ